MRGRLMQATVAVAVRFAPAQLIRPDRNNPPTDASRTIQAHPGTIGELAAVLNRSCGDCHSNNTVWPRYTQVAPLSWLMARRGGRAKSGQLSEWAGYPPDVQRTLLAVSCEDVSSGKMPGVYALVRPETKLPPHDIDTICAGARQADANAADRRRQ